MWGFGCGRREEGKTGATSQRSEHVLQSLTHRLGLSRCCRLPLGRELVQELQHTPVMCLQMYSGSLGQFYVETGARNRHVLLLEVSPVVLSLHECPTQTGSLATTMHVGKATRETLCQQGTNTGEKAPETTCSFGGQQMQKTACITHDALRPDLTNPRLYLNINCNVKTSG